MKTRMIQIILLIGCLFIAACQCGCIEERPKSADRLQQEQTAKSMSEAQRQVGMPAIVNFQERKLMKMILELRDDSDLVCYAYYLDMHGNRHFLGKCLGFGLPYSVQFTNPERAVELDREAGRRSGNYHFGTMPQPDPNGLFMPDGLAATWLMLINPETNEPTPVYVEPEIIVSPFPLHKNP